MIEGVKITPLKQFHDERGKVMHMMRCDREPFEKFGEIYFSVVEPGAIKGWHIHKEMTLNYAVPVGKIKFVLFDDRPDSSTRGELAELFLGPENYLLVTVPPMVWNGFKGLGAIPSLVANCATVPHSPDEIDRLDPFSERIPYDWSLKHG
ncbi:MAG: dTDP-4-dehydrorhamnose 3,5-epimerase [Candidatus Hydrogenedentota bacterium]|nr:MAG: dTDP-4-dehydrorhamnose 3,5-epimerase [Candidatus Hydrogenedentota bacterium]